jgi:hypothetical protein
MTSNLVAWFLRKASTVLSGHELDRDNAVETGLAGWKPYMASNGLRLVEADLFELYVNSAWSRSSSQLLWSLSTKIRKYCSSVWIVRSD